MACAIQAETPDAAYVSLAEGDAFVDRAVHRDAARPGRRRARAALRASAAKDDGDDHGKQDFHDCVVFAKRKKALSILACLV
ncbi:hypothetical protein PCAR4_1030008 [Paraburkholderia caribensis]|nr:hypothetical protein PCAR4_1030008 [Paraburkholderia caribensis]